MQVLKTSAADCEKVTDILGLPALYQAHDVRFVCCTTNAAGLETDPKHPSCILLLLPNHSFSLTSIFPYTETLKIRSRDNTTRYLPLLQSSPELKNPNLQYLKMFTPSACLSLSCTIVLADFNTHVDYFLKYWPALLPYFTPYLRLLCP